ncbi:nucleoside 2-deoxyribosyltransferase [Leptospira mtsangambouensis]|uniref:nucleoside 2-deoxyribosyltransferase n=1 Tax=Leptospira mtsangambouensis TaxID=2484912 RepID=UPI001FCBE5FA|nr:nucleoside 2-deoxyribosyltransferase [Leptospira mtsangambouensis]
MKPENIFYINWNNRDNISSGETVYSQFQHPDFGLLLISHEAFSEEYSTINKDDYYKFQSILRRYFLSNKEIVICSKEEKNNYIKNGSTRKTIITLAELLNEFPKNILDKQGYALRNLAKIDPNYGSLIRNFSTYDLYAKNESEALFILQILKDKNQIDFKSVIINNQITKGSTIIIKEQGWIAIEEFEKSSNSEQVFIAISFDPSMNEASLEIEKACRMNGYIPIRIDNKEHNNEISGEILYEIKRSKFLISEVTGQRHGVYFEAGFAMGLGIPVIWCCNESDLVNVHFDTRQYNHIVWKDKNELLEKLEKRIRATV